jgi:hypothetical protein
MRGGQRGGERVTAGAEKQCYDQENWSGFAHRVTALAGANAIDPAEDSTPFLNQRG